MSYLEIYNENIRDLLDPSTGYLELRDESRGKNIQVNILETLLDNKCLLLFLGFSAQQEVNVYFFGKATLLDRSFCSSDPDNSQELGNAE